jgi:hypothetical protein
MTDSQSAPSPARKWRWSFSLLTLLLATGMILAVISHVRTSLELEKYRQKSDAVEVADPRRIYVRRMNNTNQVLWRWRIFLPEGYHFYLHAATRGVSGKEPPPAEHSRMFDAHGEVIVDVMADLATGNPYQRTYVVTIMTDFAKGGSVTTRAAKVDLPAGNYLLNFEEELAAGRTLSFGPSDPVILLRATRAPPDPPANSGFILWIKRAAPPE